MILESLKYMLYLSRTDCNIVTDPKRVYLSLKRRPIDSILYMIALGICMIGSLPSIYAQAVTSTQVAPIQSRLNNDITRKMIKVALDVFPKYYWSQPTAKKKSQRKTVEL